MLLRSVTGHNWRLFRFQSGALASSNPYNVVANSAYQYKASFDADGDGDKDVLLYQSVLHKWQLEKTQNGTVVDRSTLSQIYSSTDYDFQSVVDVDADGDEDILLRNSVNGKWRLFTLNNGVVTGNSDFGLWASSDYSFVTKGDFDGDLDYDILVRSTATGKYRLFTVEAGVVSGSSGLPQLYSSADYTVQVASDFDGDGDEDILVRNTSTGAWKLFTVQNSAVTGSTSFNLFASLDWSFASEGDSDGDGDADILLRNSLGAWRLFTVQGGAVTANSAVTGIYTSTDWQVQR
ncbi:MAG: VCBS repeat-containing protein [Pseudomonadales bacterium]|nr:VCBS repeat-containing protein [Pseudomonadales bacterium]